MNEVFVFRAVLDGVGDGAEIRRTLERRVENAEAQAIWRAEQAHDIATNDVLVLTGAATKPRTKYVYRLTRRHADGSMDVSGVYARLIGDYARPSAARVAGDRHEGDWGRPPRVWNGRAGYWWRYSKIGVYIYEVVRLEVTA